MKIAKIGIAAVLWIVVVGLGYWLYKIIQEPVVYQAAYERNNEATVNRMKDIRTAQDFYVEVNGKYANDWDKLIQTIKHDSIIQVKTIGNPDDTTVVTKFDTVIQPISELMVYKGIANPDSLKFIPYSGGEIFSLEADMIKVQRVEIPVYQVIAFKHQYLKGLKKDFADLEKDLILGSLSEASDSGNWE